MAQKENGLYGKYGGTMTFYETLLSEIFGSLDEALDTLEKFDGLTKASRFINEQYGYTISRQTLNNIMVRHNRTVPIQKHRNPPRHIDIVMSNPHMKAIDIMRMILHDEQARSHEHLNLYQSIRTAKRRLPFYL